MKKKVYFEKEDLHSDDEIKDSPATNYDGALRSAEQSHSVLVWFLSSLRLSFAVDSITIRTSQYLFRSCQIFALEDLTRIYCWLIYQILDFFQAGRARIYLTHQMVSIQPQLWLQDHREELFLLLNLRWWCTLQNSSSYLCHGVPIRQEFLQFSPCLQLPKLYRCLSLLCFY